MQIFKMNEYALQQPTYSFRQNAGMSSLHKYKCSLPVLTESLSRHLKRKQKMVSNTCIIRKCFLRFFFNSFNPLCPSYFMAGRKVRKFTFIGLYYKSETLHYWKINQKSRNLCKGSNQFEQLVTMQKIKTRKNVEIKNRRLIFKIQKQITVS